MRLSFFNCYAHSHNSAFLKAGENMLLLDCGGLIPSQIERTDALDGVERLIYFISHADPDHIKGTPALRDLCKKNKIEMFLCYLRKGCKSNVSVL